MPQSFDQFCQRFSDLTRSGRRSWVMLARVDSTNSMARRLTSRIQKSEGASVGCWGFVAWEQTAGRGRRGNEWQSARGLGLYMTLVYPRISAEALRLVPLVTANAVAAAVAERCPTRVRIKWPNDILAGGRKLGGILVEAASRPTGAAAPEDAGEDAGAMALVGIGVNCGHRREDLALQTATSLAIEGATGVDMAELGVEIGARLEARLGSELEASEVVEEWSGWSAHRLGEPISCRLADGLIEGTFAGFGDNGSLLVDQSGKIVRLSSAEIVES